MFFLRKFAALLLAPLLSGLALSLLLASIGEAEPLATITVTTVADEFGSGANCSLREAVRSANRNIAYGGCAAGSGVDTIVVPAGTYMLTRTGAGEDSTSTGDLDITSTVIISGMGTGITIIDANNLDRAFDILGAGASLTGLTIRNGQITGESGGAIDLNSSSTLTLSFSVLHDNSADHGGALRNAGGKLILDNVTLYSNTAANGTGGGIRTENSTGAVTITNSSLYSNTALNDGGGLYVSSGTVNVFTTTLGPNNRTLNGHGGGLTVNTNGAANLTNTSVVTNTAVGDGGGVKNLGTLSFSNSLIQANTALSTTGAGNGGGLMNHGQLTLNGVTLSNNIAHGLAGGGGLRNSLSGGVTILNSTLAGNQASDAVADGGAILNSSGSLVISNSAIGVLGNGNSAGGNGGGIGTDVGTTLTLTNSLVISNSSGDDGGGIDASSATLYVANTSFISNTIRAGAAGDGGALRSDSGGTATLISVTVSGNVAENGGGLVNIDSAMTLISSTLSYNTARNGNGGGIDNRRETMTPTLVITSSSIFSNTATNGSGGGLRSMGFGGSAGVTIDNSTLSYNRVVNGNGGGVRNEGGSLMQLANVTLTYNDRSPSGSGEGLSVSGGVVGIHNTLIANNDSGNCAGTITSLDFNLDSGNSCLLSGPNDITNTSPNLGPFQYNGGPTWSQPLVSGSAGINDGDNVVGCTAAGGGPELTVDQRGFTRPIGGRCDIGAVERINGDVAVGLTNNRTSVIPGASVSYTLVVTNTSSNALTGVSVSDALPSALAGLAWTCSATGGSSCPASGSGDISTTLNLAGGGRATFSFNGPVAADATGTLTHMATAAAPIGYDDSAANNTATDADPLTPQVDVGVTNTDGQASAIPGTPITYTIVVTSAGPSTAPNTLINDIFPAALNNVEWTCAPVGGVTCPATGNGNLNLNITFTADSQVTLVVTGDIAPAASGALTNVAALSLAGGVTSIGSAPDSAQDVTTLVPTVDLGITKTDSQATARPGEILTYTLLVSNTGPSSAINATLTDTFPAQLNSPQWICSATVGSACPASGNGNLNTTISLAPQGALTVTITGTVALTATGTLTNTAYVAPAPGTTESGSLPNSATDVTNLVPFEADLKVTLTGPLTATPGLPLTFTVAVRNTGPDVANGTRVTDTFPATLMNVTWACAASGGAACPANSAGNITTVISLPVNGAVTFTVSGDITETATGLLSHTAIAMPPPDFGDPQPADNQVTHEVLLAPQGDLSVSLTDGQSVAQPDDPLTYTLMVTNPGPSVMAGVLVTNTLPASLVNVAWSCSASAGSTCPASGSGSLSATITLAPGGSATFTITALVTTSGILNHTATVTAAAGAIDPNPNNNSATDITYVPGDLYLPLIRR